MPPMFLKYICEDRSILQGLENIVSFLETHSSSNFGSNASYIYKHLIPTIVRRSEEGNAGTERSADDMKLV